MTLFWNTWNPLIYAIAGPPRHDGWFPTENDKLALKYTSSPSLCILLSPETSLTFLFLSWLGSSGASSPMSRGLRYNCTMSGSGCMALKTSCESERAVRGLKKTCLQQSYLPFLIPFCTNLRNQHRLCYRAFASNSRLTFQVHCSELPLKFLYGSLTMAIHPLSAWLTRQVLGGKLIPKHWKRSLFILLSTRSSWLWDYGPWWIFRVKPQASCRSCPHYLGHAATKTAYANHIYQSFPFNSWSKARGQRLLH